MLNNISFIIPIYNDNNHLKKTLDDLYVAIERSQIRNYEVIIVDDGSKEPISTIEQLSRANMRIIRQENQGRLKARHKGIKESMYDQVVLLDSRVSVKKDSLRNLLFSHSNSERAPSMIIAKIEFPSDTNLIGLFWDAITRIVWFRYYIDEADISLTKENFDFMPKGTTLLFSQKETLIQAYRDLTESELSNKDTNDDTLLIKRIVSNNEVVLSKGFLATYYPRTNLKSFIRHAHHRGKVAKGGYFASGTKGRKLLNAVFGVLTILLILSIYSKTLSTLIVISGLVYSEIFFAKKLPFKHLVSLNLLALPFLSAYGAGLIRSLFSR